MQLIERNEIDSRLDRRWKRIAEAIELPAFPYNWETQLTQGKNVMPEKWGEIKKNDFFLLGGRFLDSSNGAKSIINRFYCHRKCDKTKHYRMLLASSIFSPSIIDEPKMQIRSHNSVRALGLLHDRALITGNQMPRLTSNFGIIKSKWQV